MKQVHVSQQLNRWEQVDGNISNKELASLKSRFMDQEIVGIITIEDVVEELLQVRFVSYSRCVSMISAS